MSHVPLSELKAMQDKLGLKAFNKLKTGGSSSRTSTTSFKRDNKNRPSELSARRPVPRNTPVAKAKTTRDPRFDDLSGEYNEKIFTNTYGFLSDVKLKEKVEQQEASEKMKAKAEAMEKEWKKQELEKVKEGKKPFFMKKSQKKALIAEELRKEAEESGSLQKSLAKRSKKLAAKERKKKSWSTKDV
ncbi:ribosomal RNA processing protein 36 [Elysia marginata]|uniref:rRNA biogenesis protein RRP36 n=1 Tax=Elysia marginata TaxID=1093978 RepID=A0AAV4F708_9GAST|nr:ribosomal RNA processing protein 36 [Elysia marginata]